jgi:hypothetical protein
MQKCLSRASCFWKAVLIVSKLNEIHIGAEVHEQIKNDYTSEQGASTAITPRSAGYQPG